MLNNSVELDRAFQALADPSRRAMLERLARGPASVSDLAAPLAMTMAAVLQHLKVLEAAGLAHSTKSGRVRMCTVDTAAFDRLQGWLDAQRETWERRLDRLEAYLADGDAAADAPATDIPAMDISEHHEGHHGTHQKEDEQ